jgi:hypothetical protein
MHLMCSFEIQSLNTQKQDGRNKQHCYGLSQHKLMLSDQLIASHIARATQKKLGKRMELHYVSPIEAYN